MSFLKPIHLQSTAWVLIVNTLSSFLFINPVIGLSTMAQSFFEDPILPISQQKLSSTWKGPKAKFVLDEKGRPLLSIEKAQVNEVPVLFLSLNSGFTGTPSGWNQILYEIDLALEHGIVVFELIWANRSRDFLRKLIKEIGNRNIFLFLRINLWIPEIKSLPIPLLHHLSGPNGAELEVPAIRFFQVKNQYNQNVTVPYYSSLIPQWLSAQKAALTDLLNDMNELCDHEMPQHCQYPPLSTKILGLRFSYQSGGEWFLPPLTDVQPQLTSTDPSPIHNPQNFLMAGESPLFPWWNPEYFYLGDYQNEEKNMFIVWSQGVGIPQTSLPSIRERITPFLGTAFSTQTGKSEGENAVQYRIFQSERMAQYQIFLASHAKGLSDDKLMITAFGGYYFGLSSLNGLQHTYLSRLLEAPEIDAIVSPYSYETNQSGGARSPGGAFLSQGPMDSPLLRTDTDLEHVKIWLHEDDTRAWWDKEDVFSNTVSSTEFIEFLKRNMATSRVHKNGLYFFDLMNKGWFGQCAANSNPCQPVDPSFDSTLWNWIQAFFRASNIPQSEPQRINPEILVLISGSSMVLHPEFGLAGEDTYNLTSSLYYRVLEILSRLGAPIRYHLVSDLPLLDVSKFKFVMFLNSWKLTTPEREWIQTHLMKDGRSIYFQYAAGLYKDDLKADLQNMRDFLKIDVSMSDSFLPFSSMINGKTYGLSELVSPHFFCSGGAATYANDGSKASLHIKDLTNPSEPNPSRRSYRVIYAAQPLLDPDFLNILVRDAGVFQYGPQGLVVDGGDSELMIHYVDEGQDLNLKLVPLSAPPVDLYQLQENGRWVKLCRSCKNINLKGTVLNRNTKNFTQKQTGITHIDSVKNDSIPQPAQPEGKTLFFQLRTPSKQSLNF